MKKVIVFFASAALLIAFTSSRIPTKEKVQWLSIVEMQVAYKKNPKPILVDVYTSWCGWCKVMDRETYQNNKVAAYINEKYYAVKFDAESKDSTEWNGIKYGFDQRNRVNEMAMYLLYGQLSYPTTVFLASLDAKPAPLPGYLKPKEIESPLKFFGEGVYKSKKFPEYMRSFKTSW